MKFRILTLTIFIALTSCKSQNLDENFMIDNDGITVEKPNKSKSYDDNYNIDNKIFKLDKNLTYSYYYIGKDNKKYLIKKGKEIKKENYTIFDWDFIEYYKQDDETISTIVFQATKGNPFPDIADYNQTSIIYRYVMNNGSFYTMEVSGAIDNEKNLWVHPPRSAFFQILELNPFPYIKQPYKIGNKWNWKLNIGDHWSDKRWLEWKGQIENIYNYEIIEKKTIPTNFGNLECFVTKAIAKSRIGETELISYFNKDYGFVKLEYKNIDGTKTILDLEKVE